MTRRIVMLIALAAVLTLAGCSAPGATTSTPSTLPPVSGGESVTAQSVSGGSGGSGGSVKDVKGTMGALVGTCPGVCDNSGSTTISFNGTANDGNGEQDIAFITIASAGPAGNLGANHTVTSAERNATTEPASFGSDGFKVWNAVAKDGALSFRYAKVLSAFTPAGVTGWSATESNAAGVTSTATAVSSFTITSFSSISVNGAPVDATGANQTGLNWGQWSASPGDTNVSSTNYLKLTNNGDVANAAVVIDYTESVFTGTTDNSYTVSIDNNVQFAFCDVLAGAAPSSCTFTFGATSPGGSTTVTFAGKGHVIYVAYRIAAMPAIVAAQSYGATFTVTEL